MRIQKHRTTAVLARSTWISGVRCDATFVGSSVIAITVLFALINSRRVWGREEKKEKKKKKRRKTIKKERNDPEISRVTQAAGGQSSGVSLPYNKVSPPPPPCVVVARECCSRKGNVCAPPSCLTRVYDIVITVM